MHPADCLISKLANYFRLPEKRTTNGLSQIESTIKICRVYCNDLLERDRESDAIQFANKIYDLAAEQEAKRIFVLLNVDLMEAIPDDKNFETKKYRDENSPRARQRVNQIRERYTIFLLNRGILEKSRQSISPQTPPG